MRPFKIIQFLPLYLKRSFDFNIFSAKIIVLFLHQIISAWSTSPRIGHKYLLLFYSVTLGLCLFFVVTVLHVLILKFCFFLVLAMILFLFVLIIIEIILNIIHILIHIIILNFDCFLIIFFRLFLFITNILHLLHLN